MGGQASLPAPNASVSSKIVEGWKLVLPVFVNMKTQSNIILAFEIVQTHAGHVEIECHKHLDVAIELRF